MNAARRLTATQKQPVAIRLTVDGWVQLPGGQGLNLNKYESFNVTVAEGRVRLLLGSQVTVEGDDAIALLNYLGAEIPGVEG